MEFATKKPMLSEEIYPNSEIFYMNPVCMVRDIMQLCPLKWVWPTVPQYEEQKHIYLKI